MLKFFIFIFTIIYFFFIIWQHFVFGFYNIFTLTLFYFILIIFMIEKIFKKKKFLSFKAKQIIIFISFIIFIDIFMNIFDDKKKDNDVSFIGKNLTLKDFTNFEKLNGLGYFLYDGKYNLDISVYKFGKIDEQYSAVYTIKNNRRVMTSEKNTQSCPDTLLLGGSHSFGQALMDELTLQSMLSENGMSVMNFSVPGYGLLKNYLNMRLNYKKLEQCRPKMIIYRFIPDHINRDNGKSFFNPYGSHLRSNEGQFEIINHSKSKFEQFKYSIFLYLPTRFFYYANNPRAEFSIRLIAQSLSKYWFYTDSDISGSLFLLNELKNLWDGFLNQTKLILLIDTSIDHVPKKYLKNIENIKGITVIIAPTEKNFKKWGDKNCQNNRYQTKFIKYETHPTDCFNKYYIKKLKELKLIK